VQRPPNHRQVHLGAHRLDEHWRFGPVGCGVDARHHDRDGAVGSLYKVGGCPTFAYVYPGGTLESASTGQLTAGQLSARVERLLGAVRAAEGRG